MCPEVYYISHEPEGYVMEMLQEATSYPGLLHEMEDVLQIYVWGRPPQLINDEDWFEHALRPLIDIPAPPPLTSWCLTHGDCTVSNAMRRGPQLLIVDPLPQRNHVASVREADMARLIQSAMGWETLVYGDEVVEYDPPEFWFREAERRAAMWWCAATALRIKLFEREREQRFNVVAWCDRVAEVCLAGSV